MTNYSLVTVSKGEIKTVDAFIKTANSIGHNMKALCVSAYTFLNDDDKEVVKDFTARVMDELNYSNATLSQMKFTGEMYAQYNDYFKDFSYTNTYEFRKLINNKRLEVIDDAHVKHTMIAFANFTNSMLGDDIEKCVAHLTELSQKNLRDAINKYCDFLDGKVVEVKKEDVKVEDVEETAEESTTPTDKVIEEVNAHTFTVTDDELNAIIGALANIDMNNTKKNIANAINEIAVMVDALMK